MTENRGPIKNMIHTPNYHIPLGQVIVLPDGELGLRIKKNKNTFEEISISMIIMLMVNELEKTAKK